MPYVYFRPESLSNVAFETEDKVKRWDNSTCHWLLLSSVGLSSLNTIICRLLPGIQKSLEDLLHAKREQSAANYINIRPGDRHQPGGPRRRRHVHQLETVMRKTMYGMYMEPHVFIKVTLMDPGDVTKLAAILEVRRAKAFVLRQGRLTPSYHARSLRKYHWAVSVCRPMSLIFRTYCSSPMTTTSAPWDGST